MPPCTLHAPGSLVTYELQAASDVTCIPESRVNDTVMPPDLLDRDLPVKVAADGFEKVCDYILSMIRCRNAGNGDNFRREYFRPPVAVRGDADAAQAYVIYRTGRASEPRNPDLYSAKKTVVTGGREVRFAERAAFGAIVLAGTGEVKVAGQAGRARRLGEPVPGSGYGARGRVFRRRGRGVLFAVSAAGEESLRFCQHFASGSNPEAGSLAVPEWIPFPEG